MTTWIRFRRRWRAFRARAQRERAAMVLLALFAIGVGEPALCIVHCGFWLPFVQAQASGDPHAQHHHHGQAAPAAGNAPVAPGEARITSASATEALVCFPTMAGDGGNVPFHVPPSPVHDALPTLPLLLMTVCVAAFYRATRPRAPPQVYLAPPFRPPALNAA